MTTQSYIFKLATSPQETEAYFALRRSIFTEEQSLFESNDVDELDAISYPIVALKTVSSVSTSHYPNPKSTSPLLRSRQNPKSEVVGVVRIYELEPGLWYGGRLGVHRDYRRVGKIGQGLIYKAVTTANTWGCRQFLATVQLPNVRFFRRQHWDSLEEVMICDRPHHLMEADLNYYPPSTEPRPVLPIQDIVQAHAATLFSCPQGCTLSHTTKAEPLTPSPCFPKEAQVC